MKLKNLQLKNLLMACIVIFTFSAQATVPAPVVEKEKDQPTFSAVLEHAMPAVVNVTVIGEEYVDVMSKKGRSKNRVPSGPEDAEDVSPENSGRVIQRFEEGGSGVIISAKDNKTYIVTNAHVIRDAKLTTITLSDARRFKATLVGEDRLSDIAVLEITAKNLTTLPFGDSDKLEVGNFVAAIGNPFGLHQTVTTGVVSALHRSDLGIEGYENFIQTDASINPGNSGGALINLKGQLVGINTALIGPIGGNVGIGLAIPSNMVKQVADQIIKNGKVDRGVLGVYVQDLTPALADAFGISGKKGALVTNVITGSPAAKAGMQAQDVVNIANGVNITTGAQLRNMMGLLPAGTKVNLHVLRGDKALDITVTVESPSSVKKAKEKMVSSFFEGVRLTSYDELVPEFGPIKGVGVLAVDETSDAWIGGLRAGDVILAANGQPVINLDSLMEKAKANPNRLLLKVGRGGGDYIFSDRQTVMSN